MRNVSLGCSVAAILALAVCSSEANDAGAEPLLAPGQSLVAGALLGARSVRDDTLVPLASTGPSLTFFGRFLGTTAGSLVDAELRFGGAPVFDRDARPGIALAHAMRLAYLPVVRASAEAWSLAIGPALAWDTDVFWLAKWDDAHAYWLGRRWIGPSVRAWRQLSTTLRLDVAGEFSLFGFESRPPAYRYNKQDALTHLDFYFAGANRDASFGSIADFQAVRLNVDVHRFERASAVPNGWGLGVEARVAHSRRPEQAFVIESAIRLERAWGLP